MLSWRGTLRESSWLTQTPGPVRAATRFTSHAFHPGIPSLQLLGHATLHLHLLPPPDSSEAPCAARAAAGDCRLLGRADRARWTGRGLPQRTTCSRGMWACWAGVEGPQRL